MEVLSPFFPPVVCGEEGTRDTMPPCQGVTRDADDAAVSRLSENKEQAVNLSQLRKQIPKE